MARNNGIDESQLESYANEVESPGNVIQAKPIPGFEDEGKKAAEENLRQQKPKRKSLEEAQEEAREEIEQMKKETGLGYIQIPLENLPTKGVFYPEGTQIWIRAAQGKEIRHWSTTVESELNEIDDALNYMLESCMSMKIPGKLASFRDLCEIDRFYVILSIRDFTFPEGNNELKINITETKQIPLKRNNVSFIKLPDALMKFFDPSKKCFVISGVIKGYTIGRPLEIHMPTVGVTKWLKDYVQRKQRENQGFDKDFITWAPLLIPDYRGLNDQTYSDFVHQHDGMNAVSLSVLEMFRKQLSKAIDPKLTYVDEGGTERESQLNFQGGFKSLFLIGDIIGLDDLL